MLLLAPARIGTPAGEIHRLCKIGMFGYLSAPSQILPNIPIQILHLESSASVSTKYQTIACSFTFVAHLLSYWLFSRDT